MGLSAITSGGIGKIADMVHLHLRPAQSAPIGPECWNRLLPAASGRPHRNIGGNNYVYDAWGNLNQKQVTKCSAENLNTAVNANNRLQSYDYDSAGNMAKDNNATSYVYDAENRIAGATGFTYTYDADGNRVEKSNGTSGTLYWYMTPGIVAESDLSGALQSEYVFFGGERVARKDFPSDAISYYFSDHLKTASVITDAAGTIKSESDYYPWGGELQLSNGDSNHYKFTGKERDAETGLDYFGARHYSNGLGRFITPDWSETPVPIPYADLTDPQSLNQYSYVRNLPTSRADLDGHDGVGTVVDLVSDGEVSSLIASVGRGIAWGAAATTAAVTTVVVTTGVAIYHSVEATKAELAANQADRDLTKAQDRLNQQLVNNKKNQQQQGQEQKTEPEPQTATGGAGQRTGGGRNERKSNQDRQQSAKDKAY